MTIPPPYKLTVISRTTNQVRIVHYFYLSKLKCLLNGTLFIRCSSLLGSNFTIICTANDTAISNSKPFFLCAMSFHGFCPTPLWKSENCWQVGFFCLLGVFCWFGLLLVCGCLWCFFGGVFFGLGFFFMGEGVWFVFFFWTGEKFLHVVKSCYIYFLKVHFAFIWLEGKTNIIADHGQMQTFSHLFPYGGTFRSYMLCFLRTSSIWRDHLIVSAKWRNLEPNLLTITSLSFIDV